MTTILYAILMASAVMLFVLCVSQEKKRRNGYWIF